MVGVIVADADELHLIGVILSCPSWSVRLTFGALGLEPGTKPVSQTMTSLPCR